MAQILDFWDFSGYNSITVNNRNYYEASHYRPFIADRIAKKAFTGEGTVGAMVTADNVAGRLTHLQLQIDTRDGAGRGSLPTQ